MGSNDSGKETIVSWVRDNFPIGSTCLDVGPCDGKWFDLLGDYLTMDAVEIFEPNITKHNLEEKYRKVVCGNIADCTYEWYDIIILGDVIEHMPIPDAQDVLKYASERCHNMIVAVPFLYPQDEIDGNPFERHIQDDLTPEVFSNRYPGFRILHQPSEGYAYYVKDKSPMFSVIVPTHNGADRLPLSLSSVLKQTYNDYELIVVCDACDDDSERVAMSYGAKTINVNYYRDGLSRNAGIEIATGEWILFLDDDDYFLHEFCFKQLADKILSDIDGGTDLISFSIVWKGRGYRAQSPELIHSMVWSRAWRRSFFNDKRFGNLNYGSDSAFFNAYVLNATCGHCFWDMPLYYYNVREGSLSAMLYNGLLPSTRLDIVITHYNEPWEVGKRLFDSIMVQECIRMEHVNLILVQDGADNALPWEELLAGYPFYVDVITLPEHRGVGAARNAGMDHAVSGWVMFMDFDDKFADLASLSMITRLFPVGDDVDVIWCKYIREVFDYGRFKDTTFNCEDQNDYRMIGKMYRLDFLRQNNIRFTDECPEYADIIFNSVAYAETYAFRIMNFFAPFYPFFKKLRLDGAFSTIDTLEQKVAHQFRKDIILMDEMKQRGKTAAYRSWLVRTVADAYHSIRSSDLEPDENHGITPELIGFWKQYRDEFMAISLNDREVMLDDSQTEAMTYIQEFYNYFGKEYYMQNDMISFDRFIEILDEIASETTPAATVYSEPDDIVLRNSGTGHNRAVVYCGTKETYVNMLASVKSLLATTPVDKVFFLIEDDEFPYEIPDIIETRNVKNTTFFDPSGPNFTNVWTYMCLMRTAFPAMFPEYDKILSLDIDIVITEDVSCLWDIDLTDYYFAGVPEEGRVKNDSDDMYANFGVIMMNLDKLRRDGLGDKLIEAVNTEHFGCPEQDAFNKYCKGHIYQLPNDYNVTVYSHITGEPLKERILHYAGLKYWKHFGPVKKYFNLSWPEIMSLQESVRHG